MKRLVLLRHGQTHWNLADRAQGHADISLDEVGLAQAVAVAPAIAAMSPSVLWSSDLARARETARVIAAACGLPVVADARFREFAVGDARTGLTLAEYAERHPEEHGHLVAGRDHLIPGRESRNDLLTRMLPALGEVADSLAPGETGVVVSHGACLRTATRAFLAWPESVEQTLGALANCAWIELEQRHSDWDGSAARWRLVAWNRVVATGADPDFTSDGPVG